MSFEPTPAYALNAASGLLLIALGLAVARVRPRRPANTALAVFSCALGLRVFLTYLDFSFPGPWELRAPVVALSMAANATGVAAVFALALRFPRPLGPGERRHLHVALAALGAFTVVFALVVVSSFDALVAQVGPELPASEPALQRLEAAELVMAFYMAAALLMVITLFALRHGGVRRGETARERPQYLFTSAALAVWPAMVVGGALVVPGDFWRAFGLAALALFVLAAAAWLRNASRSEGAEARAARNLALLLVGLPLVGMVLIVAQGGLAGLSGPQFGVSRTATVLLLAYAMLRHQLLGIDVKVRWTLQKSTIAAAFVGVFFVVSEGAQSLFSESAGPAVGIVAAGALVFAMAPLQRAAERLASAAVPADVGPRGQTVDPRRERYKVALRAALRDGRLTDDERIALAELAHGLGLRPHEYEALRIEVERDLVAPRRARRGTAAAAEDR